jgi:diacylglycerol kinase family enzyme
MEKVIPRTVANWLAGFLVLGKLPIMRLEVKMETERRRFDTPALWVGLGMDSLRLPRPGDAVIDGETLEIVTPTTQRRAALVALMLRMMVKLKRGEETPDDKALDVLHTKSFTLDSPHRIDVGIDGEPHRLQPPLHFRYESAGLKVLCLVAPS